MHTQIHKDMDEKQKHAVSAALVAMAVCTVLLLPATLIASNADKRISLLESQLAELQAAHSALAEIGRAHV